jgi:DNA-binding LytR/AlgR family response regulator
LRAPGRDDASIAHRLLPRVQRAAQPLRWIRATAGGGEHLIRTSIVELVAQLDAEHYWQLHRSTIINLEHLAGTRRDEASWLFVRMNGVERERPVSRAYVHLFKAM